jgi:hypothetical protein
MSYLIPLVSLQNCGYCRGKMKYLHVTPLDNRESQYITIQQIVYTQTQ